MSLQQSKIESRQVSRRVQQTKQEIEQLKTELQKLINRGINHTEGTNNVDYTNTSICSKPENEIPKNIPSATHTALPVNKNTNFAKLIHRPCLFKTPQKSHSKEPEPRKKERHYNVEEAREYIKKQKEKRLDMLKSQVKQSQNNNDLKKEKLKELQAKSLQLVKKNVEKKREKSKSRENLANKCTSNVIQLAPVPANIQKAQEVLPLSENHFDANGCLVPDLIVNNVKRIEDKCLQMPVEENGNRNAKHIHPHLENVTIRTYDLNLEAVPKLQPPKQSPKYDFRHNAASVKIQATYRGYRQRKLYKTVIRMKRKLEEDARKLAEEAIKREAARKEAANVRTNENCKTEIPFWLETVTKPYPYNFISAVKRKLNFSINPPTKTYSDAAVQSSVNELYCARSKQESKMLLADSVKIVANKSLLSHEHLDLNLKNIEGLQLQIKSDANGCDIEENSLNKSGSTNKTKSSKLITKATESSGSDTSKNIPDISSESADNNHSSSNAGHFNSELNLGINVDRLKDLKLKEKMCNGLSNNSKSFNTESRRNFPIEDNLNLKGSFERNDAIKKFEEFVSTKKNSISLEHKHSKSSSIPENFCNSKFKRDSDTENESHSSKYCAKSSSVVKRSHESQIRLKSAPENYDVKIWNGFNSSKSKYSTITTREKLTQKDDDVNSKLDRSHSKSERVPSVCDDSKTTESQRNDADQIKVPESFKSLLSAASKSSDSVKTYPSSKQTDNSEANYSTNFSNTSSSVPSLKRPTDTLTTSQHSLAVNAPITENRSAEKHVISIRPGEVTSFETKTNTNQIHLKFEAELHLLNDFNESLHKFMAVEKSLLELQSKTQNNTTMYNDQDTQTSAPFQPETEPRILNSQSVEKLLPTINYSRGSEVIEDTTACNLEDSFLHPAEKTLLTTGMDLSETEDSMNSTVNETNLLENDSYGGNVFAGLSLGMFDQLIKDEDSRIENLKTILKIREKALLDRTKGELAWLEIQKKQLIETGQLHEASLLKKKQRGIVIKLQHEKQEMQRLKQMQKVASKERKIILKEQRNMIKAQLSSGNIVTRIKRNVHKDRTRTGPVKVYNLHRETINTETSISKRNSATEELIITSRSESTVSRISDCAADFEYVNHDSTMKRHFSHKTEHTRRFLLMREAALQKRRKAAEDLLQWHQRLLEEERKIAELEMAANTIINQVPVDNMKEKYTGKDGQLNSLWLNVKEVDAKIKTEDAALELNRRSAKRHTKHRKNLNNSKTNDSLNNSVNNKISDLSETVHTEASSDADSNANRKSQNSEENTVKSIPVHIEIEKLSLNKSITDETVNTNQSSVDYTSEFESPEVAEEKVVDTSPARPDVLENEIDRSKSTLNEIMQNISNITDEISAIYKLSCANTSKNDNNNTQDSNIFSANDASSQNNSVFSKHSGGHESNNLQSQIVKSLSELIKTQSPCQDIRSLRERSIIETPEAVEPKNKLNESQNTLASSSELQTNLPEVETEGGNKNETVNVPDSEARSSEQNNVDSGEKMVSLVQNYIDDVKQINDDYQSERTVISDLSSLNKYSKSDHNERVSISDTGSNKSPTNSVKSAQVILDLSYGFVPCTKNSEDTDVIDENPVETSTSKNNTSETPENENGIVEINSIDLSTDKDNTLNNLFKTDSTSIIKTVDEISEPSLSKDDTEVPEALSLHFSEKLAEKTKTNEIKSIPYVQENPALPNDVLEDDLNTLISDILETKVNEKEEENCVSIDLLNNHIETTKVNEKEGEKCVSICDLLNIHIETAEEIVDDSVMSQNECAEGEKPDIDNNASEIEVTESKVELILKSEIIEISENRQTENTEEVSTEIEEEEDVSGNKSKSESASTNQKKNFSEGVVIDVKKRVSEILADANSSPREDKSPRLQDIYTTTYDVTSPDHSPEAGSPVDAERSLTQLYGEEAEALFKKQLAIEQEIKQLEQQQKEQIPYLYLREIPNKPPPPYTPPSTQLQNTQSVLPHSVEQIDILTTNITDVLYEAYSKGYLQSSCPTRNTIKSLSKSSIDKECYEFVFDLCKELAIDHYKQFIEEDKPSWLKIVRKSQLAKNKPYDKFSLKQYLDKRIKELLGFEKVQFKENAIIKWSRKKRDHVDELLVLESQTEESDWTNYDEDEVIVRNEVTNDIMNMLLQETANVMNTILRKRTFLY